MPSLQAQDETTEESSESGPIERVAAPRHASANRVVPRDQQVPADWHSLRGLETSQFLRARPRDPELLHPKLQGRPVHPEPGRRPARPSEHPLRLLHDRQDVLPFDLF
jgi:hypothetical protein